MALVSARPTTSLVLGPKRLNELSSAQRAGVWEVASVQGYAGVLSEFPSGPLSYLSLNCQDGEVRICCHV